MDNFEIFEVPPSSFKLTSLERLRGEVYVARRFLKPEELTDGRDVDEYDPISRHVGVFLPTGEAIGTLRVIPVSDSRPLQITKYCGIEPEESSVEASRFVVHPRFLKGVVGPALIRWFIATCTKDSIEMCYALVEGGLYEHFLKLGLPFEQLGPMVEVYESWNIPIGVKIKDMIPGALRADETSPIKYGRFFSSEPHEGAFKDGDLKAF